MSDGKRNLTNIAELLGDMNGGTVAQVMEIALSDAALGVLAAGKKTKANVSLDIALIRIGESQQVTAVAKLKYKIPTMRGDRSETYAIDTPLYVGRDGKLTVLPENQIDIFTKQTRVERDQQDVTDRLQQKP